MSDVTVSALNGMYKQVYGDGPLSIVPKANYLIRNVDFVPNDQRDGAQYNTPVILVNEQGFSYGGTTGDATTLNGAIAMTTKNATVQGTEIVLRSVIGYTAAAKATNNANSFKRTFGLVMESMGTSASKRVELMHLYGGSGLGQTSGSFTSVDATTERVTIGVAAWAAAIWAGQEGTEVNFYNGTSLVSSGANAVFTISAVDFDNRYITVTGTSTGITALHALSGTALDIYFRGAYGNESTGIDKIITTSGTLFGISNTTYNLWKGNSYAVGSTALTLGKLLSGVSLTANKGCEEDMTVLLNPATWTNVMNEQAGLRKYDGSYKRKSENGFDTVEFYSLTGAITLVPHKYVKQGEAFAFPSTKLKRVGASDVTFKRPGQGDDMIVDSADKAGYEVRLYTNQALFCEAPGHCVKYTGITNS